MVKYKQKCISCNNFVSNDLIIYNRCPDCNLIRTIGNMKSVHIKKYIKGEQNAKNEF